MNRKKIALLLTGLMITSSLFTGCTFSNSSDKKADKNNKVAQEESYLKRASERTVRELDPNSVGEFPNVAYAEDTIDNSIGNDINPNVNSLPNENQFDNSKNNFDENNLSSDSRIRSSKDMSRSSLTNQENNTAKNNLVNENGEDLFNDSTINDKMPSTNVPMSKSSNFDENGLVNNDSSIQNFESSKTPNQVNGFSNVVDDDLNYDTNDSSNNVDSSLNSSNKTSSQQKNINNYTKDFKSDSQENINSSQTQNLNDKNSTQNGTDEFLLQEEGASYGIQKVENAKEAGRIEVVKAVGKAQRSTNRYQGVAEVSFKLSGEIIQREGLAQPMQEAYEEARKDANADYSGATTTKRKALITKLQQLFAPSTDKVDLVFESSKGIQSFKFKAEEIFPDKDPVSKSLGDYIKNVIDLDYTDNGSAYASKRSANRNPEDIVMKMMIRVGWPKDSHGLYTNTEYKFLGTKDNVNLIVTDTGSTSRTELVGFSIPSFKTGKQPVMLETKITGGTSILYNAANSGYNDEAKPEDNMYFNAMNNKTYINMKKLLADNNSKAISGSRERVGKTSRVVPVTTSKNLEISGTSIKFKSIILKDIDETITEIKLEDDRGEKYKVELIPVDSNDSSKGKYIEVVGLKRETPYIFTKMLLTANVSGETQTKTVVFASRDSQSKVIINDIPIKTATFEGPQLSKPSSTTIKLPNGLTVPTVKNDSTALRYVFEVNNSQGLIQDVRINGLRGNEQSKIEKLENKDSKMNYYIVTLYNLSPNTDYGFVILETDYKDASGNTSVSRQALKDINLNGKGNTDNKTEVNPLTGNQAFNVIVNDEIKSDNSRSVEVPIFMDDMQSKFIRVDFESPKDNPDVIFKFEDNKLKFSNLKPESNFVYKVDFVYQGENNSEERISKYIKINTPKPSDLDIKSTTISPTNTSAKVVFDLYNEPKSQVKSVSVVDNTNKEITSSWDKSSMTLTLDGLSPKTQYSELEVTFTLENGKNVVHKLESFTTLDNELVEDEAKPTGKVAEFVARVYKIALGREPEVKGWTYWIEKLESKQLSATEFIAENLMTQPEFVNRELSKKDFIKTMYSLIVNREPDEEGQSYWERRYDEYKNQTSSIADLRIKIAREMMNEPEFKKLVTSLNLNY